jgi:hypothetical protein
VPLNFLPLAPLFLPVSVYIVKLSVSEESAFRSRGQTNPSCFFVVFFFF